MTTFYLLSGFPSDTVGLDPRSSRGMTTFYLLSRFFQIQWGWIPRSSRGMTTFYLLSGFPSDAVGLDPPVKPGDDDVLRSFRSVKPGDDEVLPSFRVSPDSSAARPGDSRRNKGRRCPLSFLVPPAGFCEHGRPTRQGGRWAWRLEWAGSP